MRLPLSYHATAFCGKCALPQKALLDTVQFAPPERFSMPPDSLLPLLDALRPAARVAGERQLALWRTGTSANRKADGSPVTEADRVSHTIMEAALTELSPGVPLVSEEGILPRATPAERFWMLDPLDGTKAFLRGEPDFVLCLALIDKGRAVGGLMHAPAHDIMAWGAMGEGAWLEAAGGPTSAPIRTLTPEILLHDGLDLLVPSVHPTPRVDAYLGGVPMRTRNPLSSAMKFLRILQGEADAYLRFERIQQWDIAAGDALLNAAGGDCLAMDGQPLRYGWHSQSGWQSSSFIASGVGGFAAMQQLRLVHGGAHA